MPHFSIHHHAVDVGGGAVAGSAQERGELVVGLSNTLRHSRAGAGASSGHFGSVGVPTGTIDPGGAVRFTTIVTLVTGTMFVMWLGEADH